MSVPKHHINKRIIRKACVKYYKLGIPPLIHALFELIQLYTPCDASEKYLTNPYKNLLYAITGASNVTRKGLIEIINEIQSGPLADKWLSVLRKTEDDIDDLKGGYAVSASFNSRPVPVEIDDTTLNITFPDVSLDLQEEIQNLRSTVKEIDRSLKEQSQFQDKSLYTLKHPLTRQKDVEALDLRKHRPEKEHSFLDETLDTNGPDFKNILSSTVDESLENAINVAWRMRDGNLEKLQKVTVPKMPPKDKYPIKYNFFRPEPMQKPKSGAGVITHDKLQAMVDELGVYKSSYDRKIKDHKWPQRSKMRYPLIGVKQ